MNNESAANQNETNESEVKNYPKNELGKRSRKLSGCIKKIKVQKIGDKHVVTVVDVIGEELADGSIKYKNEFIELDVFSANVLKAFEALPTKKKLDVYFTMNKGTKEHPGMKLVMNFVRLHVVPAPSENK